MFQTISDYPIKKFPSHIKSMLSQSGLVFTEGLSQVLGLNLLLLYRTIKHLSPIPFVNTDPDKHMQQNNIVLVHRAYVSSMISGRIMVAAHREVLIILEIGLQA